jgi:hypothetical protein
LARSLVGPPRIIGFIFRAIIGVFLHTGFIDLIGFLLAVRAAMNWEGILCAMLAI